MNARSGNVLLSASRLSKISITEIGWGALAVASAVWSSSKYGLNNNNWNKFRMICAVFVLAAGLSGVLTIRRLRRNIPDIRSFNMLGGCNLMLCIIGSVGGLIFLVVIILLRYFEDVAHSFLGVTAPSGDEEGVAYTESSRQQTTMPSVTPAADAMPALDIVLLLFITGINVVLTGLAAVYSFRISAALSTASQMVPTGPHTGISMVPPAGVPLLGGPGYGSYPMAHNQSQPMYYTPDPPFKQNLSY